MSVPAETTARKRRWKRAWHELRSAAVPVVAFWGMTGLSLGLLIALYLLDQGVDEGLLVFLGLGVVTFVGIGLGQVAALLRIRSWFVVATVAFGWFAGISMLAAQPPVPEEVLLFFALAVMLGPLFALAGLWSLRVHMGLLATWAPLVYLTACIIVIAEQFTGSASRWFAGDKWAMWDVFSLPVLLAGVAFLLVYLAARERHRIALWRFAPGGPDLPDNAVEVRRGTSWLRGGCSRALVAIVLAVVLAAGTALAAPYLWRSAPADSGGDGPTHQPQPQPEPPDAPPNQGCNQQQQQQQGPQPMDPQQVQEVVKQAGISILALILTLFLGLLGMMVFIPPLRRALLLRHLRRPLWPVPPTRQVLQAWRVVEIALADIGIQRRPGDSAEALVQRAIQSLPPDVDHTALRRCAALADRVLFGLGVDPSDPEEARRTAEMAYQVVWELLGEGGRIKAVYRFL